MPATRTDDIVLHRVENEHKYLGGLSEEFLSEIETNGDYSGVTALDGVFSSSRYVVGLPVYSYTDSTLQGYVFVSGNLSTVDGIWRQSASVFAICAFAVMAVAFILCLIMTRRQVEPINEMAEAAYKFARGFFRPREEQQAGRDRGAADSLNRMADSLRNREPPPEDYRKRFPRAEDT
jgi:HAMP domain-containing protein